MQISILENEYWYGPAVAAGWQMPFGTDSTFELELAANRTGNQVQPLLLSSLGRFVWCKSGFSVRIADGVIQLNCRYGDPIQLFEGFGTLRGAYLEAQKRFFPADGQLPPLEFFAQPQYNTWIELIYNQNQTDILNYAETIVRNKMPKGVIMIDDLWSNYYGRWEFDRRKFPDPKAMMDRLHELGFKVMLWMCPFVTPDSLEFRNLRKADCLVKNPDGSPRLVDWWNGYSGVLDFSNPNAVQWFREQTDRLVREYGVDGFKFDAGDPYFYRDDDVTYAPIQPNEQCEKWAEFGLDYPYNEYRACWKCAGKPLVQRLHDKRHSWSREDGLASLVPNILAQGLLGYAFGCPDMVGGGSYSDFLPGAKNFDSELFVRSCAAAILMPMVQFSAAPWRVLSPEHYQACLDLIALRQKHIDRILKLAREAAETGEPIARYPEYVFPHQGLETVTDEFLIGNDLLVAPVLEQGATGRLVRFPEGNWKSLVDDTVYSGGKSIYITAELNQLPAFVKVDEP